jgi:hypothetical protein
MIAEDLDIMFTFWVKGKGTGQQGYCSCLSSFKIFIMKSIFNYFWCHFISQNLMSGMYVAAREAGNVFM